MLYRFNEQISDVSVKYKIAEFVLLVCPHCFVEKMRNKICQRAGDSPDYYTSNNVGWIMNHKIVTADAHYYDVERG